MQKGTRTQYARGSWRTWGAVVLAAVGCAGTGPKAAAERTVVRAETFWMRYVQPGDAEEARPGAPKALRGRLFAIRVDDGWLTTSTWVKCPLEGSYHYEPMTTSPPEVELWTVEDAARFLPHGYQFFADKLAHGGTVRIRYVVAGRYVLDGGETRTAGIVCNAATHYAKTIVVGAYRVELTEGRARPGVPRTGATRVEVEGALEECAKKVKGATGPIAGCEVPLAYELRELALTRGAAKLYVSDAAGPQEIPSPATMPRAVDAGGGARVDGRAGGASAARSPPAAAREADPGWLAGRYAVRVGVQPR